MPSYLLASRNSKYIVYNVLKTENGWQIQAFLPRSISPADRMNLLEWFRSYRSEVQLLHPSWLTLFKATDRAYFLDVIPVQNPRHMLSKTAQAGQVWEQLELNYA